MADCSHAYLQADGLGSGGIDGAPGSPVPGGSGGGDGDVRGRRSMHAAGGSLSGLMLGTTGSGAAAAGQGQGGGSYGNLATLLAGAEPAPWSPSSPGRSTSRRGSVALMPTLPGALLACC